MKQYPPDFLISQFVPDFKHCYFLCYSKKLNNTIKSFHVKSLLSYLSIVCSIILKVYEFTFKIIEHVCIFIGFVCDFIGFVYEFSFKIIEHTVASYESSDFIWKLLTVKTL
jgi:hypothetical protein